jgi:hypothetical protein
MNIKTEASCSIKIYIAGDYASAKQWLHRECVREGLCVTIQETEFIYTNGAESGVVVGLENYPRFPKAREELQQRAEFIARGLMSELCQSSAMIVGPSETMWLTTRSC